MENTQLRKINFRQGKYILPAILYIPILFLGYAVIGMFDGSDSPSDSRLHTTQYLNGDLPDADVDTTYGDKMDNVDNEFGKIHDLSGVANADVDSANKKKDYESQYSDKEAQMVAQQEQDRADLAQEKMLEQERNRRLREMQDRVRSRANRRRAGRLSSDDGFTDPVSDNAIAQEQRRRRQRQLDIINRNLAAGGANGDSRYSDGARNGYQGTDYDRERGDGSRDSYDSSYGSNNEYAPGRNPSDGEVGSSSSSGVASASDNGLSNDNGPVAVVKKGKDMSDYFNTIGGKDKKRRGMITAIIDENIKVVDGSRVRLRLLDDVEIGGETVKKGTYLYARMSGFSKQRVQGRIESIFLGDEILKVSLSIYDTDGLQGLYVPESSFRESAREIAGSATEGGTDMTDNSSSGSGIRGWASQAARNVSEKTMEAFNKLVKKNRVRLKYGTRVYLVDGSQQERSSNRRRNQSQQGQYRTQYQNNRGSVRQSGLGYGRTGNYGDNGSGYDDIDY